MRKYVIFDNTLVDKVAFEETSKQIGLATSRNSCDHFYLTIPHKRDYFLQIAISLYLHNLNSIENLMGLPCYFSIASILKYKKKLISVKRTIEKW